MYSFAQPLLACGDRAIARRQAQPRSKAARPAPNWGAPAPRAFPLSAGDSLVGRARQLDHHESSVWGGAVLHDGPRPPRRLNVNGQRAGGPCRASAASAAPPPTATTPYLYYHVKGGGKVEAVTTLQGDGSHQVRITATVDALPAGRELFFHWGVFRDNQDAWTHPEGVAPKGSIKHESGAMRCKAEQSMSGSRLQHEMVFNVPGKLAPVSLAFSLYSPPVEEGRQETWFPPTDWRGGNFVVPIGFGAGSPQPLGLSRTPDGGFNFAVFSRRASSMTLCLYREGKESGGLKVTLPILSNRTGDVWHVYFPTLPNPATLCYGWRAGGTVDWTGGDRFNAALLVDPLAEAIAPVLPPAAVPTTKGAPLPIMGSLAPVCQEQEFDWEGVGRPRHREEHLVVYEMRIRDFTAGAASGVVEERQGTYAGALERIGYLSRLGVTAVMLHPVTTTAPGAPQDAYPVHFAAPTPDLAAGKGPLDAPEEFKFLVRELHRAGIEVLLQVEYGPTGEGVDAAPVPVSFRGLDASEYYLKDLEGAAITLEGSGALSCNNPPVRQLIVESLRRWALDYHVDGFVFRGAEALTREHPSGSPMAQPPIVEEMAFDPVLRGCRLVAHPGNYEGLPGGERFPHWGIWGEINRHYGREVHAYLIGSKAVPQSVVATRLSGSSDLLSAIRRPGLGYNAISRLDGPGLMEMCGRSPGLARTHFMALLVSQGVPIIPMGDEVGAGRPHAPGAASGELGLWEAAGADAAGKGLSRFVQGLIAFRRRRGTLLACANDFEMAGFTMAWLSENSYTSPEWVAEAGEGGPPGAVLAAMYRAPREGRGEHTAPIQGMGDIYVAFNPSDQAIPLELPAPGGLTSWRRIADSSYPSPADYTPFEKSRELAFGVPYELQPFGAVLMEAGPASDDYLMTAAMAAREQQGLSINARRGGAGAGGGAAPGRFPGAP